MYLDLGGGGGGASMRKALTCRWSADICEIIITSFWLEIGGDGG